MYGRRKITPGLSAIGSVGGYKKTSFSENLNETFILSETWDITTNSVMNRNLDQENGGYWINNNKESEELNQSQNIGLFRQDSQNDSIDRWPIRAEDYRLEDVIGFGASAVVQAGFCIPRQEKCAIKKINLEQSKASLEEIRKEIHVMCSCSHENVLDYYTSFVVEDELWIVLRLHEGGSLLDIIKETKKTKNCQYGVLDEEVIATVVKEVLKGLDYLHRNGQIHRDIKAGNILIGKDGSVQIADFGVSAVLASDKGRKHTFVGTPCWMSPELIQSNSGVGYNHKTDIWSLGITVIEMVRGSAPYINFPPIQILMLVMKDDAPKIETGNGTEQGDYSKRYGKSIRNFIASCLTKDPARRPNASELLKHPFLRKAKDKNFLQQKIAIPQSKSKVLKSRRRGRTGMSGDEQASTEWEWDQDGSTSPTEETNPIITIQAKNN